MSGLVKCRNKVLARPVGLSTHTDMILSRVMMSSSNKRISLRVLRLLFVTLVSDSTSASTFFRRSSTSSTGESSSYSPNVAVVRKCLLTALANSYSFESFSTSSSCIFNFPTSTSNSP
ncbi:hypothetical protein M758_5G180200 [Ceratodon purpureus]|nr:hypothetical protein M758_5G180200 [Ceratodon purpureus]